MDELTRIALLGTSKFAGPIPKGDHPAAALAADCSPDDREESLLLQCGAQAVYALAGRSCEAGIEESAPAREESRKQASRKVAELLEGAAAERENTLLLEFLREMQVHDVVLPPHLLPQLLEFKDAEVRRRLVRVLGERGAWLCGQNPDWAGAVTAEEDPEQGGLEELRRRWDEGAIDERRQAIERLRTVDPDRARGWVEEVYSKEKHGNRIKLLESLRTGLCGGDEPFLERCLEDRSAAVGQAAASLLQELPRSAFAGRMLGRAAAMLGLENGKLTCTPPSDIDAAWERDGIKKRAAEGEGLRASWAEQLLAVVPPSAWPGRFSLDSRALIEAVADDPFAQAVIAGWTSAAGLFAPIDPASAEWLEPLWDYHVESLGRVQNRVIPGEGVRDWQVGIERLEWLLSCMSSEVAERALAKLLKPHRVARRGSTRDAVEVAGFLERFVHQTISGDRTSPAGARGDRIGLSLGGRAGRECVCASR